MDGTLIGRAGVFAEPRLASLPRRLAHVRAVAARAEQVAAWLHDLGYADSVRSTGFHPVDGARLLVGAGFPALVVSLVAYHTGAVFEAEERGAGRRVGEDRSAACGFAGLTFADMTTGPDGDLVDPEGRLAEILTRYPRSRSSNSGGDNGVVEDGLHDGVAAVQGQFFPLAA